MRRSSFTLAPAVGETAYSWLLRYHIMSGNLGIRDTLEWLGTGNSRPTNEFPTYLPALSQAMEYPLNQIIQEMTPYRYYATFLANDEQRQFWQRLVTGKTTELQAQLGNVAGRVTPGQMLYYCPDCVQDDINQYGFPYWHVSHQLVGVIACSRHHVLLQRISRKAFEVSVPTTMVVLKAIPPFALRLAELAVGLQTTRRFPVIQSFDEYYRQRLRVHQLLTSTGRIRMRQLRNLISNRLKALAPYNETYRALALLFKRNHYPESLFYTPTHQHPIKHLMLVDVLYDNFDDFREEVTNPIAVSNQPDSYRSSIARCQLSNTARHFLQHGESLRSVSVDEGLSVATLKILAQQEGIQLALRPQKIFAVDERSMLMKLLMGLKTQTIAKKHRVSVGAIEHVLRKHPELVILRKKMRFNAARYKHRNALTQCIAKFPNIHRQELRNKVSASYSWLFKHDNAWLYSVFPERQEYQYWPRKNC